MSWPSEEQVVRDVLYSNKEQIANDEVLIHFGGWTFREKEECYDLRNFLMENGLFYRTIANQTYYWKYTIVSQKAYNYLMLIYESEYKQYIKTFKRS